MIKYIVAMDISIIHKQVAGQLKYQEHQTVIGLPYQTFKGKTYFSMKWDMPFSTSHMTIRSNVMAGHFH